MITKINTIANLKARKGTPNTKVEVLGYYAIGDGGGGEYYWDNTSTSTDNGGSIIQVTGVSTGRWIATASENFSPKRFGAKARDNSFDNSTVLQNWLNYLASSSIKSIKLEDSFYCSHLIFNQNHSNLEFGYGQLLKFETTGTGLFNELLLVKGSTGEISNLKLINLDLKGFAQYTPNSQAADDIVNQTNGQWANGIAFAGQTVCKVSNSYVINCRIEGFGKAAVSVDSCENIYINNLTVTKCSGHAVVGSVRYGGFGAIGSWPTGFRPSITIDGLFVHENRTAFDLAGTQQDGVTPTISTYPAKATISNVVASKIDGRTKIDGWWACDFSNLRFENDLLDNLEGYPALALAATYMPPITISNMVVSGFTAAINGSPSLSSISINLLSCNNCLYGVVTGVTTNITNFIFENGFAPLYCSTTFANNTKLSLKNFRFSGIRKNRFTTFKTANPTYWTSVIITSNPITTTNYINVNIESGRISDIGEDSGTSFGYLHSATDVQVGNVSYKDIVFSNPPSIKPYALIRIAGGKTLYAEEIRDMIPCTTNYSLYVDSGSFIEGYDNQLNLPIFRPQAVTTSNITHSNQKLIPVNTTSGNVVVTVTPSVLFRLQNEEGLKIVKISTDSNTVTISPSSGTINGQSSLVISSPFKGVVLYSDNTNLYVVDRLDPVEINSTIFSGDGLTLDFVIVHGKSSTPNAVVTPASADAQGIAYITVDSTNITVSYNVAPPAGTNNVKFNWQAK